MPVDIGLQRGRALLAVRDVELQDARLPASRLDFGLHGFCLAALLAAVQHQIMAGVRQRQRNRAADAAARAGYEDRGSAHSGDSSWIKAVGSWGW
ncbi:hypothetical protein D9M68_900460 [compost metagenome]